MNKLEKKTIEREMRSSCSPHWQATRKNNDDENEMHSQCTSNTTIDSCLPRFSLHKSKMVMKSEAHLQERCHKVHWDNGLIHL